MKQLLTLLLLLSPLLGWGQRAALLAGPAVTVEASRTYCLVRFVQTLAGDRSTYWGSRRVFEQSRFHTLAAQGQLRRYRQLDHDPSYQREEYPEGRIGAQVSLLPAYLAAAADAADLPDLQRRTAGLLPNEVLVGLDSVYRFFAPAFDTLAWQPHAAGLARLREAYATYLINNKLMQKFGRLRAFYGSVWPDALPYRVLLSPELDQRTDFTNQAHALGNLVVLDCHPASRDFASGSAVVFHEMSHTLSMQQRLALQRQVEKWYLGSPLPSKRFAYNLMEEALATVAGEWLYAQQAGQPEAGEWYHDDYINRYAHALYPLMTSYVERGQELDSAFVAQAISLFHNTFPQAATDYVNLFRNTLYWTDSDDPQATQQPFRDAFRSTFTYDITPIVAQAKGLEKARSGDYLPVIIITRQHAATLRYLRQQLPALRGIRLRPEQSFVLSTTGPAGPIVVVCAHDPAQLAVAAERLKQQGRIDAKQPLMHLP